jgi:uncharacterized protein (DUF433 family)
MEDHAFPHIAYRRGASGHRRPAVRGTGVHVQTLVLVVRNWGMTPEQVADDYGLSLAQVQDALAYYAAHRDEINEDIRAEEAFELPCSTAQD